MKAQLVKRQDRFDLYNESDGSKIASTLPNPMGKLSIANCEAIANGYDLNDIALAFRAGIEHGLNPKKPNTTEYVQSLQHVEWDVEIEMEPYVVGSNEDFVGDGETHIIETKLRPQLDVDGCLILKRK